MWMFWTPQFHYEEYRKCFNEEPYRPTNDSLKSESMASSDSNDRAELEQLQKQVMYLVLYMIVCTLCCYLICIWCSFAHWNNVACQVALLREQLAEVRSYVWPNIPYVSSDACYGFFLLLNILYKNVNKSFIWVMNPLFWQVGQKPMEAMAIGEIRQHLQDAIERLVAGDADAEKEVHKRVHANDKAVYLTILLCRWITGTRLFA